MKVLKLAAAVLAVVSILLTGCDARALTPFRAGAHLWYGFVGTDTQGRADLGIGAVVWTREGESRYIAAFPLEFNNQTISPEDPQLLGILGSLAPSGSQQKG